MTSMICFEEGENGPTGKVSPGKVSGALFTIASPGPLVLYYAEIGPSVGIWTAVLVCIVIAVLGVGLWWGAGRSLARKGGERLLNLIDR